MSSPHVLQANRPRFRKRLLRALSLGLGLIIAAGGFAALSVWIESRFPSDDPKRAFLPSAQRIVTKPVMNALNRQAEAYLRRRAEAKYLNAGLTVEEAISRFLDDRIDITERRMLAFRLAREGSPKCIKALVKVLQSAPPESKVFIAQLIGNTGNPAAKAPLWFLLEDPNERVVMATIRGLSLIGGDDVVTRITAILSDEGRSQQTRAAAAVALGTIGSPAAYDTLVEHLNQLPAGALTSQILSSLGRFEFPAVEKTFKEYLSAPGTPSEMRVAAAESLARSSQEAVPFLLGLAQNDNDPDVRASAAWAISVHVKTKDLGPTLAELAEREPAAEVRQRLYEALLPQDVIPSERLLPIVRAEEDIEARVAGFNAIGRAANQQPSSLVASTFNQSIVPELVQIATAPNSLNVQMRAVFALRRARTADAQRALAAIARSAPPQIARAAQNGLSPPSH